MGCNISSIARNCLTIPCKETLAVKIDNFVRLTTSNGNHAKYAESWLTRIFLAGYATNAQVSLAPDGIRRVVEGGNDEPITCSFDV